MRPIMDITTLFVLNEGRGTVFLASLLLSFSCIRIFVSSIVCCDEISIIILDVCVADSVSFISHLYVYVWMYVCVVVLLCIFVYVFTRYLTLCWNFFLFSILSYSFIWVSLYLSILSLSKIKHHHTQTSRFLRNHGTWKFFYSFHSTIKYVHDFTLPRRFVIAVCIKSNFLNQILGFLGSQPQIHKITQGKPFCLKTFLVNNF